MTDEKKALSVNPTLAPRTEVTPEDSVAEQGPPPADYAARPESGAPPPSGESLTSTQVADLLGSENTDATTGNDTNRALQEAEGIDPDAGQN